MLPKIARISAPTPDAERRGTFRRVVTLGFGTRETSANTRILIMNLSRTGLLLQTVADLAIGELIQIEIPEAGLVEAEIVRRTDDQYGARFTSPVSQAAISAVLLASPAQTSSLAQEEKRGADRIHFEYSHVPQGLLWAVMTVTMIVVTLFVCAIGFLPIAG